MRTRSGKGRSKSPVPKKKKVEEKAPSEEEEEESSDEMVVQEEETGSESSEDNDDDIDDEFDDSEEDESEEEGGMKKKGFSDDNSSWLKPKSKKSQLLDSDDDSAEDDDDGSDDDDNLLEIERESKLIDKQMEEERVEAEQELRRTIAENTAIFHLPTEDELADELDGTRVVPPSELRERINEILTVLADFKNRREEGRSRSEYIAQLASDMAEVFGYLPELVEYFLTMFNPSETLEFLEASDTPRPLVIRTNTLKCRRKDLAASLLKRGVTLDPLANWSKVGLKITASPIPIGATPEYLSGQYMLQSAASFCPVLALNPKPGKEVVLDMSAAPGGKTSYLAQLMRNTGIIIANDLKPERQKATVANMHRLGARNVVTSCYDGRKLGKLWKNRFTKILLDAPCSGLGVISRDPSVKVQRTIKDVDRCGVLQKELLLNAIDALSYKGKDGGIMVYSTCSVSVTENEDVVNYVLGKRDVKLLDAGLDFGKPGFTRYQQKRYHPSLALTRRFYPHVHNMDGFYVAKIQKLSDKRPGDDADAVVENVVEEDTKTESAMDVDEKEEEEEEEEGVDWAVEVKKAVAKSKKGKKSSSDKDSDKKSNDKKKREGDDALSASKAKKAKQETKSHTSVPPKNQGKRKKKPTSAKMTKPRRRKQQGEM